MGVDFSLTQEKGAKYKKKTKGKGRSHFFHRVNKYVWAEDCPNLQKENKGKIHTNFFTVNTRWTKKGETKGVSFFENHQKTKTGKTLDPNR